MTHTIAFSSAGIAAVAGCALVALGGWFAVGGLRLPGFALAAAQAKQAPAPAVDLPPGAGNARARSRCDSCGVVEAIRRFESAGKSPAGYEFTVRLRDGSTRVSSDANRDRWRIGDSIMLIGGPAPSLH